MKKIQTDRYDILVAPPAEFGPAERALFRDLVIEAGEVAGDALNTNIENAKALAFLLDGDQVRGIAALKHPQASYRDRIGKSAGTPLPLETLPYEFGYAYILQELQGKRLSLPLACAALDEGEGAGMFATVRADNVQMQRTLAKAKFESAGSYPGREDRTIMLLVRNPQSS